MIPGQCYQLGDIVSVAFIGGETEAVIVEDEMVDIRLDENWKLTQAATGDAPITADI